MIFWLLVLLLESSQTGPSYPFYLGIENGSLRIIDFDNDIAGTFILTGIYSVTGVPGRFSFLAALDSDTNLKWMKYIEDVSTYSHSVTIKCFPSS